MYMGDGLENAFTRRWCNCKVYAGTTRRENSTSLTRRDGQGVFALFVSRATCRNTRRTTKRDRGTTRPRRVSSREYHGNSTRAMPQARGCNTRGICRVLCQHALATRRQRERWATSGNCHAGRAYGNGLFGLVFFRFGYSLRDFVSIRTF